MTSPGRRRRAHRADHAGPRLAAGVLILLAAIVFALDDNHPVPVAFAVIVLALIVAEVIWT